MRNALTSRYTKTMMTTTNRRETPADTQTDVTDGWKERRKKG